MKSGLEDLGWVEWRSFETSVDVTVVMTENNSPEGVIGMSLQTWINRGKTIKTTFSKEIGDPYPKIRHIFRISIQGP